MQSSIDHFARNRALARFHAASRCWQADHVQIAVSSPPNAFVRLSSVAIPGIPSA